MYRINECLKCLTCNSDPQFICIGVNEQGKTYQITCKCPLYNNIFLSEDKAIIAWNKKNFTKDINMTKKPFNKERALAGDPMVYRNGNEIKGKIGYSKYFKNKENQPLILVCEEYLFIYSIDGRYLKDNINEKATEHEYDLFMASKTVKKYLVTNGYMTSLLFDCFYSAIKHRNCCNNLENNESYKIIEVEI